MTFNADQFLNSTVTGPMSTSVTPCPEGEFRMVIDDGDNAVSFNEIVSTKPGPNQGKSFYTCTVLCSVLDDSVKTTLEKDKVLVPFKTFLDMKTDGTGLDLSEGKNVGLGRLRKALGQNDGAWSPLMMKGKGPFVGKVIQRADDRDPETKYAEVVRVSAITS